MRDSLTRSLAISIAAHAVLFLMLALLIPHSPLVFAVPTITFVEAQTAGSGGARGSGDRMATTAAAAPAVSATPRPATPPQAPPAQQAPATLPADVPAASPPATSGEPPAQVPSGVSSGSGPAGSGGTGDAGTAGGAGGGTANASAPESDTDSSSLVADINPTPMWPIAPSYPSSARRLGQQGLVKVETDIDEKGAVVACRVAVASGFPTLDKAAVNAVQQARFFPAMKNGRPVASRILVPIKFRLTGG